MPRRWTVRVLTCLALAPLALAGCSHARQASSTLPQAGAPASTTAALPPLGPADFPVPAEARQKTPEGFNAFTLYYVDLVNRLQNDLDPKYLRAFSRGCTTCDRIANDALSDASKNYRYRGGTITVTSLAPAQLTSSGAETAFIVDQDSYLVVDSQGVEVPGLSGAAYKHLAAGAEGIWSGDHWTLTNLSFG